MPVNKVSAKRERYETEFEAAKPAVRERSRGFCEAQVEGVCTWRATEIHHRKPRGRRGGQRPRGTPCLLLCLSPPSHDNGYLRRVQKGGKKSYRQAQERQRSAEVLMRAEKEHRQSTEEWARSLAIQERKAWARATYLYGVASRLGATAAELQGWESNDVVPA